MRVNNHAKGARKALSLSILFILLLSAFNPIVLADVFITEIMYNTANDPSYEWIELYNNESSLVNLSGYQINSYEIDNISLAGDSYAILARNITGYESFYGDSDGVWNATDSTYEVANIASGFSLGDAESVMLNLTNSTGHSVDLFNYNSSWNSNQSNYTIEKIVLAGNSSDSTNWQTGSYNGTPGADNDNTAPTAAWMAPANNTIISSSYNIIIELDDAANSVDNANVSYNSSTYQMTQSGLNWTYAWDTTDNADGEYNITVNFNDSLNNAGSANIYNITVDNTEPSWSQIPANQTHEFGSAYLYDINATDIYSFDTYAINDTNNFSIASNGTLTNATALAVGEYYLTATINDSQNNQNTTSFYVNVTDTTRPSWTQTPANQTAEYGSAFTYDVNATDLSSVETYWISDNVNFTMSNSSSGLMTNNTYLNISSYPVNLWVNDTYNNTRDGSFYVNVYDTTDPVINAMSNLSLTFGNSTIYNDHDVMLWANVTDLLLNETYFTIDWGNSSIENVTPSISSDNFNYTINSSYLQNNMTVNWSVAGNDSSGNSAYLSTLFTVANRAPTFSGTIANYTWAEDVNQDVNVSQYFTDADNDTLAYTVNNLDNMSYTVNGTTITLDPDLDWTGTNNVTFRAEDPYGSGVNSNTVQLMVTSEMDAPRLISGNLPNIIFNEDSYNDTLYLNNYIYDPDGNSSMINYSISINDSNVTVPLDANTTNVNITSTANWYGSALALVTAKDSDGFQNMFNFRVNVTSVNDAPVAANPGDITLAEDFGNWTIDLTPYESDVDDYDTDTNLTWEVDNLSGPLVSYSFNTTTDILTLNSLDNIFGEDNFTLSLSDYFNLTSNVSLWLNVTSVNDNPVINQTIADQSINEDNTLILDLTGYGADINDSDTNLSWSVPSYSSSVWYSINVMNDTLTFTPLQDVGNVTDEVTIRLTDSLGGYDSQPVNITINGLPDAPNAAVLASPANNSEISLQTVSFDWNAATDPDGDSVEYFLNMTDNNSNSYSWGPMNDTNLTYSGLANSTRYTWYVISTDSTYNTSSAQRQFTTSTSIVPNNAPVLAAIANQNVNEDATLNFNIIGSDADNDYLTFSCNYSGITVLGLNSTAASVIWTPDNDEVGTHTIVFNVTDGTDSDSQPVNITVSNTNDAPVFATVNSQFPRYNETFTLDLNATEVDTGDTLTYGTSSSYGSINSATGLFTWALSYSLIGTYTLDFNVTDGTATDTLSVNVTVTGNNTVPTISAIYPSNSGTVYVADNTNQQFNVNATDSDGDTLRTTWTLAGSTADTDSGNNAFYTLNNATGLYTLTASVTDNMSSALTRSWTVNVTDVPIAGSFTGTIADVNSSNVESATGISINNSAGQIYFGSNQLNLTNVAALDGYVNLSTGVAGIDVSQYPVFDTSAGITMYGLSYTETPTIYFNDGYGASGTTECGSVCSDINYTNGILTFSVSEMGTFFTAQAEDEDLGVYLDISDVEVEGAENDEDELKPGEKFTVRIEIENDADFDIEDIELDISIQEYDGDVLEDDDGSDLDDEAEFDLDEGDDERDLSDNDHIFTFELPYDLDNNEEYIVYVEAIGYNADNTSMTVKDIHNSTEIGIEKQRHEIKIDKLKFMGDSVSCSNEAKLMFEARNIGRSDEDVNIEIYNTDLGFWVEDDFSLDEDYDDDDNQFEEVYSLFLLDDVQPGSYPVTVELEYEGDTIEETANLLIESCVSLIDTPTPVKSSPEKVVVKPMKTEATTSPSSTVQVKEDTFRNTSEYFMILAIAITLVLGSLIFVSGYYYPAVAPAVKTRYYMIKQKIQK